MPVEPLMLVCRPITTSSGIEVKAELRLVMSLSVGNTDLRRWRCRLAEASAANVAV